MPDIRFHWKVGYMSEVDYEVYNDGPMYRVSLKSDTTDYEQSIYNGSAEDFARNVKGKIGILVNHGPGNIAQPVKPEVLAAFNTWRQQDHDEARARWLAKYGEEETREFFDKNPAPAPAVAGYYDFDAKQWVREAS